MYTVYPENKRADSVRSLTYAELLDDKKNEVEISNWFQNVTHFFLERFRIFLLYIDIFYVVVKTNAFTLRP